MSCKNWNVEWVASLYGELESPEEQAMQRHLASCAACRRTLDRLSASRRLLGELAAEEASAPRVVVLQKPRLRRPGWAFAAGWACATLLFAVGALVGSFRATGSVDVAADTARRQQAIEARFASLEASLQEAQEERMTRPEVEQALRGLEQRLGVAQARNTHFLLEEINATEFRAGRWVDETRQAIELVALQNDPRFRER